MGARVTFLFKTALASAGLWTLLACGGGSETSGDSTPRKGSSGAPVAVAGMYEVDGLTTVKSSGDTRRIQGTMILAGDGGRFTASFNLATTYPTRDGPMEAEVIGTGDGVVKGNDLSGKAETQIVIASAPGIDTQFAFIPRIVSTKIVSKTVGEIREDGTLLFEVESEPAKGERYEPTRTVLRGKRTTPAVD